MDQGFLGLFWIGGNVIFHLQGSKGARQLNFSSLTGAPSNSLIPRALWGKFIDTIWSFWSYRAWWTALRRYPSAYQTHNPCSLHGNNRKSVLLKQNTSDKWESGCWVRTLLFPSNLLNTDLLIYQNIHLVNPILSDLKNYVHIQTIQYVHVAINSEIFCLYLGIPYKTNSSKFF